MHWYCGIGVCVSMLAIPWVFTLGLISFVESEQIRCSKFWDGIKFIALSMWLMILILVHGVFMKSF